MIRNTIIICLILLFHSVNGQESRYLIIDQNHQKLKHTLLSVYKNNELVKSLSTDKHGKILLKDQYMSPDYKLKTYKGFCCSDTIICKTKGVFNKRIMIAMFNDSCLTLQKEVNEIDLYADEINKHNKEITKTRQYNLDSIDIQVQYFKNTIKTKNHFKISSSELEIDFFLKKDNIVSCYIKELNPNNADLYKGSNFYYENAKLIHEWYFIAGSEYIGNCEKDYNKHLTQGFLKRYIQDLLEITTNNNRL